MVNQATCDQPHAGARCTEPAGHGGDWHRDVNPRGQELARWPTTAPRAGNPHPAPQPHPMA